MNDFQHFLAFPRGGKSVLAVISFSLARENRFLLFSCFPPWGKADFRWILIFPHEGKPIFLVFYSSEASDDCFFRFLLIRDLGQPIFLIFYPSEASDSQEAIPLILGMRRKTRKLLSPAWLLILSNSAQLELGLFNCSQIQRNSTVLQLQSRLEKKLPTLSA